jgi:hypothetical protein
MEFDVIEGAKKTIKKFKPVIYTEADRPNNRTEFLEFIKSLGYDLWEHRPPLFRNRNFKNCQVNEFENLGSINMVCLPSGAEPPNMELYGLKSV